jgi:hypothetical protein
MTLLPRIVLGHNAFFGVDHLSTRRGAERAAYFSDIEHVMSVVNEAVSHGAGGLMLSTHPRAAAITDRLRRERDLSQQLQVFPLLPYAQKYVTRANELGMVRVVTSTLSEASVRDKAGLGIDFLRTVLRRDPLDMVRALMRLELRTFRRLDVPVVFLHDALADLLLALDQPMVFGVFEQTLKKRFGTRAGVATKNLPYLVHRFEQWGLRLPVILTHVNKAGFHVNPGIDDCEAVLQRTDLEVMAMGTLASGYLTPDEAFAYVRTLPAVKSLVVGASSREHIAETFRAIGLSQ